MRKKLIQERYAALVFISIFLSVVVVGALGIITILGKTNRDVETPI